ncbi:MAG: NAD(+) synthase [Anaerolineae bacterium]|nr:NAD(+) synthase [Anaerolineae bacterium]
MTTMTKTTFNRDVLKLDPGKTVGELTEILRDVVHKRFKKRGAVVGVSGGIDSSTTLALCVRAFGPERVLAVMMPEKESSPKSLVLGRELVDRFGCESVVEDITGALVGLGCYQRRDEAIKRVFPEYDPSYKAKITLPTNVLEQDTLNVFSLTIISPEGEEKKKRLGPKEYLQIVAATNFKQRTRTTTLYYHAEARNYAVIGTPNKNEHDQGFFVKWGDGGYDFTPIGHLFKTQVYQLAAYLGVPERIQRATPTTDTYTAEVTQEEFFFQLPFEIMDLIWYAWEHGVDAAEAAAALDLTAEQVARIYRDFDSKKRGTDFLRTPPLNVGRLDIAY